MVTFFIILSITLNLVAFLSIINLYTRQNRLKEIEKTQSILLEEMEQSIAAFIIQMKEDNENFLMQLKEVAPTKDTFVQQKEVENNNSSQEDHLLTDSSTHIIKPLKQVAVNKYKQTLVDSKKANAKEDLLFSSQGSNLDINLNGQATRKDDIKALLEEMDPLKDLTIQEQIALLKKQGLTNEQMAQKLKMGKTELELMIKFQTTT